MAAVTATSPIKKCLTSGRIAGQEPAQRIIVRDFVARDRLGDPRVQERDHVGDLLPGESWESGHLLFGPPILDDRPDQVPAFVAINQG